MKKTFFTIILACAAAFSALAQVAPYEGALRVSFPDYTKEGDRVTFRAEVDFYDLGLSTRQMIEVTPILRSTQTSHEERFAPIVIAGRQRARVIERAETYGDYTWAVQPSEVIVLRRHSAQVHEISVTVPFQKWMRYSELVLVETTTACSNLQREYGAGVWSKTYARLTPYSFPAAYQPVFTVLYQTPEVEPVKTMSETFSARLQFPSGKSTLTPGFGNNAQELDKVDRIIGNLKLDSLLTIRRITVTGYASPEGSAAANQSLSQARAQSFVNYLQNTHNYRAAQGLVSAQGMGEDWAGLRTAVAQSTIQDRNAILSAIDHNYDDNRKEDAIKALSGGHTWRILLDGYFPQLRRNEYTIEYQVRGFNAQEAKQMVWSRPELLSLNELFMAANQYEPTSQEYKDIFLIAAKNYPNSSQAQFNAAAMEIENGAYDSAISRLLRLETPEAWNNLGIAFWYKGDYQRAVDYFQRAMGGGQAAAGENLRQYNTWFADRD